MRLILTFLLTGTAILALPSPRSNPNPRPQITAGKTLSITQPLNETTTPTTDWPTICYHDTRSLLVDRLSCAPLITYLMTRPDYAAPKVWLPSPIEPELTLEGCQVKIVSGKWQAVFSMRDVVVEMMRILLLCQPPRYLGIGGSAPVEVAEGFRYAAFHVQVTGVAQ